MKLRTFLSTLFCLPLFGCIHWPGIDNKKHKPLNEENAKKWIPKNLEDYRYISFNQYEYAKQLEIHRRRIAEQKRK